MPPFSHRIFGGASHPLGALAVLVALVAPTPRHALAQEGSCPASLEQSEAPCGARGKGLDSGSAPAAPLPGVTLGNPVSLVTGAKRQQEVDFALDGASLAFLRHYDSANVDIDVGLGPGWRHSHLVSLYTRPDGGRDIVDSVGRLIRFDPVGAGDDVIASGTAGTAYRARLASDGTLVEETANVHVWRLPDGRALRFRGSWLIRVDWPAAVTGAPRFLSYHYRDLRVASVTDETGRTLGFAYTPGRVDRPGLRDHDGGHAQPRAGHLAALVLPDGRRVAYGYDRRGNLAEARFDDGTARTYHYEDPVYSNHLTGLTERTGTRFATWAYDERGRAVSSEHAGGVERVTLAYDAPHDRGDAVGEIGTTTVTDSLGATSVYTWRRDPASRASLLLSASGAGCATCPPTGRRYTYSDDARLLSAARLDDDGTVLDERRYGWTDDGWLASVHERGEDGVERLIERREYARGLAVPALVARRSVNPAGEHTVETIFDGAGRPVAIVERGYAPAVDTAAGDGGGLGRDTTVGAEPAEVDPAGTDSGSRTARADTAPVATAAAATFVPIERTTRLGYADGRLATIDGPREDVEDVTRLEWDTAGRLVAILQPASPAVRILEHDALGRPSAFRLGTGSPWRVERNGHGDIVRVTHRALAVTYTHDAEGRVVSISDTDGRTLRLEHDAAGRPARMIDDLGRVTTWLADSEGRVLDRTHLGLDGSLVHSLERIFDARGRLAAETETRVDGGGELTTWRTELERDAAGRLLAENDPASGARRTLDIDPLARLATLTEPSGAVTTVELDALGHRRALTDARGNRTETLHDDFGRLVRLESPDAGVTVNAFDAAGNVVRRAREGGAVTAYAWDAANRLVSRQDADGTTTFTYGDATSGGAHGRLVEATNRTTAERFTFDAEGQLAAHTREIEGHHFETRYAYDTRGRLVDKYLPDGQRLRHHYHESGPDRGRLRAITRARWFGLASETLVAEIDLDARDGETGHLSHGGLATRRRFAPNGEIASLQIDQALRLDYRFDAAGRIVGIEENGRARRYGYTDGRLTRALTATGTYTYRYDAVGNRLERTAEDTDGVRRERYRYAGPGQGNRLLSTIDEASGLVDDYVYAADGTPGRVGDLVYTYDAERRPLTVSRAGRLVARYAYNPFGERVSKTVYQDGDVAGAGADTGAAVVGAAPVTTHYLYDGTTLVAETDGAGRVTAQYVHLDDHGPVAKLERRTAYAIHTDHLGTPRLMTDGRGDAVWRADYTPFGEARIELETVRLDLRLPGQYADAETGTHYNYLRDYDPRTGRYVTSDPIGLAGGVNTYAYADADPLGVVDPLGLFGTPSGADSAFGPALGPAKPSADESAAEGMRRFGYFSLWVGEQYLGYARGFLNAAGETVMFAVDVARYVTDASLAGLAVDIAFEDPPAWLPSFERFERTNDTIVEVAEAIARDPSLIWQAISDPFVSAWASCRYGEALGRGAFEAAAMLLPAGLAGRLATLGRVGRVSTLSDILTVLRRADSVSSENHALAVRELAEQMRAEGRMEELIEAARQSDTLDDLVRSGGLTPEELRVARPVPPPLVVGPYTYTGTAGSHVNDIVRRGPFAGEPSRPYMTSLTTIEEIRAGGTPIPDPGGVRGAVRYDVPGVFRGTEGIWELVLHPSTGIIYHFLFRGT